MMSNRLPITRNLIASSAPRPLLGNKTSWKPVGTKSRDLYNALEDLYWQGIQRDVEDIIKTLREWRDEQYSSHVIPMIDGCSSKGHMGFGTFTKRATGGKDENIETDIMDTVGVLEDRKNYDQEHQLALLLLQGAAFLDIDKLVEYRPPDEFGLWITPRAPQLDVEQVHLNDEAIAFAPLVCTLCKLTVRGTHFSCLEGCKTDPEEHSNLQNAPQNLEATRDVLLCENCARKDGHPSNHMRKQQKHSIVPTCITPQVAEGICPCISLSPTENPFPFTLHSRQRHLPQCPLRSVAESHEKARYIDLIRLKNLEQPNKEDDSIRSTESRRHSMFATTPKPPSLLQRMSLSNKSISSSSGHSRASLFSQGIARSMTLPFARKVAENIPFGNVHMALSIGPLVIENGVPDSNRGVLITLRGPMQLLGDDVDDELPQNAISVGSRGNKRTVYQGDRPRSERRVKACMKQVASGLFCGLSKENEENSIAQALVEESANCRHERRRTRAYNTRKMTKAVNRIVSLLKKLLQPRLGLYLSSVVQKLFDPRITLEWNIRSNHCQKFCTAILDHNVFGDLVSTKAHCQVCVPESPLYLLSFAHEANEENPMSRKVRPKSKKSAPNGLIEEFLLRFRKFGHHNESDVVDTLSEYWSDWGSFGTHIFNHQDLFPWDCTEAFGTGNVWGAKCNNCEITQHVWAFPFDSWSLIHFHLFRHRRFYPPTTHGKTMLADTEWMQNRLRTLVALQSLNTIAVAMSKTPSFRVHCKWIPSSLKSQDGTHATPQRLDQRSQIKVQKPIIARAVQAHSRARLAGIFRAQPNSHLFEQSKYHDCELAPWADLVREDQIKEYIELRDQRADILTEIPPRQESRRGSQRLSRPTRSNGQGQGNRGYRSQTDDLAIDLNLDGMSILSVSSGEAYEWDEPDLDEYGNDVENDFDHPTDSHHCTCDDVGQSQTDTRNGDIAALIAAAEVAYAADPEAFDLNDFLESHAEHLHDSYDDPGSSYDNGDVNSSGNYGHSSGNYGHSSSNYGHSSGGYGESSSYHYGGSSSNHYSGEGSSHSYGGDSGGYSGGGDSGGGGYSGGDSGG